jgi:hypothetical protein
MVGMHKDGSQLGIARLVEFLATLLYFFKKGRHKKNLTKQMHKFFLKTR